LLTFEEVKENPEVKAYMEKGHQYLGVMGIAVGY